MKPTVILVDDDQNLCQGIQRSLKNEPYRILAVHSAQECIDLIAVTEVQVVIADLNMPGFNGTILIDYLKDARPDIINIVLSGTLNLEAALHLINKCHVFRCLEKPCSTTLLALSVREAFEHHALVNHARKMLHVINPNAAATTSSGDDGCDSRHWIKDENYNLSSLIRDAVNEVEKLDRVLSERCEGGRPSLTGDSHEH